jgi:nucleoid-associated protein YgaU
LAAGIIGKFFISKSSGISYYDILKLFIITGGSIMSSYYKKINGKNYDKLMLDIAEGSVLRKGDGRISLADSRAIIRQIKDGGKITDIESRTLNYILENYKLTETALKHIEKSLSDIVTPEIKKDVKNEKAAAVKEEVPQMTEQPAKAGGKNKIFLILVLLLLAVFAVFAFFKYFYKNTRTESTVTQKQDESASLKQEETAASKTETAVTTPVSETTPATVKTEPVEVKPLAENEYMVKDLDTLIKISEAVYGDYRMWDDIYKLNKVKIKNPNILFTGQILTLPEKK